MGSNSSSGSSSDHSPLINGLKFGQKVYFEDAAPARPGGCGGPKRPGAGGGKAAAPGGNPPRCQVEGCQVDLSDAKAYYSRHKVCGMHSKSPVVIVGGLQQRFCQQCSRFHQLPEFDQGKRSCRRRLAGHNERRRKPPPGSLLSSRLGRLSSSLFGDGSSKAGGFVLDFSSYSSHSGKDPWPGTKSSERSSQTASTGKYLQNMWPGNSEDPPPEMFLQGSAGGNNASFSIPLGECITGVSSDSSCALSLLSNQTWGSRNRASDPGLGGGGGLMNLDGTAPMTQPTPTHSVTVAHLPGGSNSNSSSSHWGLQAVPPDPHHHHHHHHHPHLGLGQISHPLGGPFNGDLLMDHGHDGGRHYMEVDHSRAFSSAANSHIDWSL